MTTILHKRGTGRPSADNLSVGEIALDTSAGTAYTKLSNGTVVEIGGSPGGVEEAPENGKQYARVDASWEQVSAVTVSDDEPADPVMGQLWYKPSEGVMYVYDGTGWQAFGSGNGGGGDGGGPSPITGESILIMGAGGGGGGEYAGGGGGAGAFFSQNYEFKDGGRYTASIGAGGRAGASNLYPANGEMSFLIDHSTSTEIKIAGGGAGGCYYQSLTANDGGSGGGASHYSKNSEGKPAREGGKSVLIDGNGVGSDGGASQFTGLGGGGGGAGEEGGTSNSDDGGTAGNGGDGLESNITGESVYYGGGGAGGIQANYGLAGTGGLGGGGTGINGDTSDKNGVDGLGGGGAGCALGIGYDSGGKGGDGCVIIRTKKTPQITSGDPEILKDGEFNIYICTSRTDFEF